MAEGAADAPKVSFASRAIYSVVLFFAYWFGASRFDIDRDGDFDAEDVEAYLKDEATLAKNFRQSRTSRERSRRSGRASNVRSSSTSVRGASTMLRSMTWPKDRNSVAATSSQPVASQSVASQPVDEAATVTMSAPACLPGPLGVARALPVGRSVNLDAPPESQGAGAQDWRTDEAEHGGEDEGAIEERDEKVLEKTLDLQLIPWFIIFHCFTVVSLWLIFATLRYIETGESLLKTQAGLDSIGEGSTDLRLADEDCLDRRAEVWRWFTYQYTHVGVMHVVMNAFLTAVLGIPLEGLHGSLRMLVMYNVGVVGGALCYAVTDAHTFVVGCSGGCYALIGISFADLLLNWGQRRFRIHSLVFLTILVGADAVAYLMSLDPELVSHSAHVGGCVAGLLIGCLIGRDEKVHRWELVVIGIMGVIGFTLTLFCVAWLFVQDTGPRNIWEAADGKLGWCWVKQIYSKAIDRTSYVCIRCGTQACIDDWSGMKNISTVSLAACEQRGYYFDGR
eukprot:CAMPEP_0176091590 /NCGR_PEP_ID=MMETSP0120_2-20121206/45878_1 /TAXON_ID=160619 /ORGANISM="Kryptoperidinium foliaceum, Strain CCMP 1326" /LENGTH=506 /DNA_ID=CAMNT_0017425489 /DNA_START=63 /DNA_END=1583 /DNA_ORIENTATION=+